MKNREPDFNNILKILRQEKPERSTLFEFFLNANLYEALADNSTKTINDELRDFRVIISACNNAGYDYATIPTSYTNTFRFHKNTVPKKNSKSLNEGFMITNEESFKAYNWGDPEVGDYEVYNKLAAELPPKMKLIACGPGGVLENAIELVGYENLCLMSLENEELCQNIFDEIGSRLLRYYEIISAFPTIGAIISNDDWGFKTQTMFSPSILRRFIFPWHKKIVEAIHAENKPAILHSCGNRAEIMEDIIEELEYDGLHSFEDIISPVEVEWKKYHKRIAILGGIDMDFLSKSTPKQICKRAKNILELTSTQGSYALGSGNSIANYIPFENYTAMIETVFQD